MYDKYQEEPPSNSQWTDGDYHPDIDGVCEDWIDEVDNNVIPLTKSEAYAFQELLKATKQVAKRPTPQNRARYAHFLKIMRENHRWWTGFEM